MSSTTLAAALNATDTTLTATNADDFPEQQFAVWIDAERLEIAEGPPSSTTWVILRDIIGGGSPTQVAADNFNRSLSTHWGTATLGGAWAESSSEASVDGSVGHIIHAAAGSTTNPILEDTSVLDAGLLFRFASDKLITGADAVIRAHLRHQGAVTDDMYRLHVFLKTTAGMGLKTDQVIADVGTTITAETSSGLTHVAGTYYLGRFEAYGTGTATVRAKIWTEGTDEPATWLVSGTNAHATLGSTTGRPGLGARTPAGVTNAPIDYTFDDLSVYAISAGISHSSGAAVNLIDNAWGAGVMRVGTGAPTVYGENGAFWLDTTANTLYVMSNGTWRSEALT